MKGRVTEIVGIKERERNIFHLLIQSAVVPVAWDRSGPKKGSRNSIMVSLMADRRPNTRDMCHCSPSCIRRERTGLRAKQQGVNKASHVVVNVLCHNDGFFRLIFLLIVLHEKNSCPNTNIC